MNTVDLARRKEAMHALNPFAPGAGRQPKELVGREQELEIMDRIIARTKAGYSDRGLVYSGLRGVGKTVLLLRMKDMAAGQGLITVRMEATGNETHDYELLFDGISKAILRERRGTLRQKMLDSLKHVNEVSLELGLIKTSIGLGNEDKGISSDSLRLEMMVEELCRELKKEGSGLFLFIDEFQVMSSDLMGTIIGLQHSMGQEDLPFYVIAAGLPNLPGVLTKSRSYAERLFQYKRIGRLPEDETRECFEKTIGKINVRFDDDALNRLIELSKGYPYFIQAYGSAAFDESESSPIPLSAVIKGEPIAQASLDSGLYESRWQRARPLEREYMRAMASLEKSVCSSAEIAERLGRPPADVVRVRKGIIDSGLAYSPERGLLAFTVPGMGDFIAEPHRRRNRPMTTEHRENRSLPIRTAVEPASLLPLSAHMSYGQMRMALYNVAPDLQVSPRAQSFAHFGLHPPYHCTHHSNRGCMAILKRRPQPLHQNGSPIDMNPFRLSALEHRNIFAAEIRAF